VTDPVNGYSVRVDRAERGWAVRLLRPDGETVSVRACADESEARTFASTVQQHIYWLSPAKFREYYRLPEPA
jgi:hypothetical protein